MKFSFFLIFIWLILFSSCSAQIKNTSKPHPLEGKWLVEVYSLDVGYFRTIVDFSVHDTLFEAHSRKNADKLILGTFKAYLARIFSREAFKKGALAHFYEGKVIPSDSIYRWKAVFTTPVGKNIAEGILKDNYFSGTLSGNKEVIGVVRGTKLQRDTIIANYPDVLQQAWETTRQYIYDTRQLETEEWKDFQKKIEKIAAQAQDDPELLFAFYYHRKNLPFTHYLMYAQTPDTSFYEEVHTSSGSFSSPLVLKELSPLTAHLRIKHFYGEAAEIDSVFNVVREKNYKNLIIDLRNNPGGTISAMAVIANLADTAYPAGVFLTQRWFQQHADPPDVSEYHQFPTLSEANVELLLDGIHKEKGLTLTVVPKEKIFKGNIYVLINGRTGSAGEPLVYGLKKHGLAVIVGETTAGAMLSGESFSVNENYGLTIPTADYYTPEGFSLDKKGVAPHIKVESKKALDHVLKNLIKD